MYRHMTRIQHMRTKGGNDAKNQFEVFDDEGKHFLSYNSKIKGFSVIPGIYIFF